MESIGIAVRCVLYSEAHEKHASSRSLNVFVLRLREALHALVFILTVEKSLAQIQ